ncbi:MAG: META domain-containing protein [Treponema sp.]|jgi:heat shock protein HslJ|nr:META domain-containing protein [Treponema sp.]
MKKTCAVLAWGLSSALILAACATKSGAVIQPGEPVAQSFAEVQGKEWALAEIVTETGNVIINRGKLEADGRGDVFTLRADAERISGKGAPNLYFSPYRLGEDQEIFISPIAGTLMMGLVENEGLQEREYYNYLEQANQWLLTGDKLELWSETADGEPAILIFVLR